VTGTSEEHTVRLELPALARQVRLARLVAGGMASLLGFDLDAVEDLRIAVDELCSHLLETGDGSSLLLEFKIVDSAVEVTGRTPLKEDAAVDEERQELSAQILAVTCETYWVRLDKPDAAFWLRSRPQNG
jgi:hypothetical protein